MIYSDAFAPPRDTTNNNSNNNNNNATGSNNKSTKVVFDFFLVSYDSIMERLTCYGQERDPNFEQTLQMDLDHLWNLALRVLTLFEETIISTFPSEFLVVFLIFFAH